MYQITLSLSDEILLALNVTPEQASDELRLAAAVKLYELRRLSSGAAANVADMPRTLFLTRLADYGVVTFQLTEEDLHEELDVIGCHR